VAEALRAVIVDDEAPARALLREYLQAHPAIQVVAECVNGFDAVKAIGDLLPDLVFLDVQMPKLDGFEVLELLEPMPAVIFCTAYDEFALRAFEIHAVDYLLKPFGRERLSEALERVRERLKAYSAGYTGSGNAPRPSATTSVSLSAAARPTGQYAERIVVKDGANVHVIPVERLDLIEAQDDYVEIRAEGRTHLKHQSLAALAEALDPARFVRVHRSYLVNVERIARLELLAKDSRVAILHDGRQIPVSRSGHERLRELLA
jgi:two-component system LytT family response regulator